MDKWLKTGTLKRSASRTEIRTSDLAAIELIWISKMIIMKCKGRLIDLFSTVSRRIKYMSIDIEATVNERIKKSPFFSIQVDESTDVSDLSILVVIVRYLNVIELEDNFLLCYPLTKRCTGEDIFSAIQGYFCENEIVWAKCCGACSDGGKAMSGCYKSLHGRTRIVAPLLHPQAKFSSEAFARFIERSTQSICQSCKFH
ncbi:Zinc finger BED domain-containing protein 5 [Araneus ventricosus]|uniref:Zinc finger BED domain-containing protein 5 n=1 Tax=Araneus ventricosus TaxID=182803 RepID=A0A4Y2LB86_ARAVE|nr:Zinc finger BED domain-containing protein 5 [Araneus ventricosus]